MRTDPELLILLAEDDRNDAEIFGHALKNSGCHAKVQIARDGEEVIDYLSGEGKFRHRRHPLPDIILLDLKMPRINGLELLDWLRKSPQYSRIPKVMLSGSGLQPDVEEAYKLGVNTYFTKPCQMEQLEELIRLIISYWARSERSEHRAQQREQRAA